jgi:hypothetical protein
MEAEAKRDATSVGGSRRPHSLAADDPDMWILEYGLFHDLEETTVQFKQIGTQPRARGGGSQMVWQHTAQLGLNEPLFPTTRTYVPHTQWAVLG